MDNVFNSFLNRMRQCERNIRKANMADDGIRYDEELNMIFVDSECGRVVPLQVYFKKIEGSTAWWSFGPWLLDEIVQNFNSDIAEGDFSLLKQVIYFQVHFFKISILLIFS